MIHINRVFSLSLPLSLSIDLFLDPDYKNTMKSYLFQHRKSKDQTFTLSICCATSETPVPSPVPAPDRACLEPILFLRSSTNEPSSTNTPSFSG